MNRIGLSCVVLAGATLFASEAPAQAVVNPRIRINDSIDCSSAREVVAQIVRPGMSDEQKAVACWAFLLGHFYHWYDPREPASPEPVRDFARAINSYGFGPCFVNAPVLTDLWAAAGLPTRSWTITGHAIPEVFYDGAWHMLDADARAFHRKADRQIAGVEELAADPKLIVDPPGRSEPFYPFGPPDAKTRPPLVPWGSKLNLVQMYTSRGDNYRYNTRAVNAHEMLLTLRPGETLALSPQPEHGGNTFYKWAGWPKDAPATGPASFDGKVTYGNGTLVWTPDLNRISPDELLWSGSENVKLERGRLVPTDPAKPAMAVFRVSCPWVLVEAQLKLLLAGSDPSNPGVQVSTDGGHSWVDPISFRTVEGGFGRDLLKSFPAPAPIQAGVAPPTLQRQDAAGRYEYLVRLRLVGESVAALNLTSAFQLSPLSLPALKPGKNKVTVCRGPDEGVVALALRGTEAARPGCFLESEGMDLAKGLTPAKAGEPGTVVYKLAAPAPFTRLSIGGLMRLDTGAEPMAAADYSLDAGKTWRPAFKLEGNDNPDNSQFEQDSHIDLPDSASREALVRFTLRRGEKQPATITAVRLYGFYRQVQPPGAKLDVRIDWTEAGGEQKSWSQVVAAGKLPADFELTAGQNPSLQRITFTAAP